jgi:hypothetical protein
MIYIYIYIFYNTDSSCIIKLKYLHSEIGTDRLQNSQICLAFYRTIIYVSITITIHQQLPRSLQVLTQMLDSVIAIMLYFIRYYTVAKMSPRLVDNTLD